MAFLFAAYGHLAYAYQADPYCVQETAQYTNIAGTYPVKFSADGAYYPFVVTLCEEGHDRQVSGTWYGPDEIEYYGKVSGYAVYNASSASFAVALKQHASKCRLLLSGTWALNANGTPMLGGSFAWRNCHGGEVGSFVAQ